MPLVDCLTVFRISLISNYTKYYVLSDWKIFTAETKRTNEYNDQFGMIHLIKVYIYISKQSRIKRICKM